MNVSFFFVFTLYVPVINHVVHVIRLYIAASRSDGVDAKSLWIITYHYCWWYGKRVAICSLSLSEFWLILFFMINIVVRIVSCHGHILTVCTLTLRVFLFMPTRTDPFMDIYFLLASNYLYGISWKKRYYKYLIFADPLFINVIYHPIRSSYCVSVPERVWCDCLFCSSSTNIQISLVMIFYWLIDELANLSCCFYLDDVTGTLKNVFSFMNSICSNKSIKNNTVLTYFPIQSVTINSERIH